tara:strand:+ start:715 stop:4281 length:3567 start_codon:yes stop_codon:yes gene_type:complete
LNLIALFKTLENTPDSISRKILWCLLLPFYFLSTPLQGSAQLDTEFWFVAPEVWANHGDSPIVLRFSALDEAADVTVDQPANTGFPEQNITINASGTATLDLTAWLGMIENKPSNQILQRGLRIVSSTPITAYYEVNHPENTDIFTLKGKSAMGTSFYTPFQTNLTNNFTQSTAGIDVLATTDGTEVTVIPSQNLNGHPAGIAFSFELEQGETYGMRASSVNGPGHPSGTLISSNKPVTVTVSDDSVLNGTCWDMMGDQIIPVTVAGNEHIAIKGNLSAPDKVYLVATEDGTTVSINGMEAWTLNAGESYSHTLTSITGYYATSAPVIALHVTGFGCEVGQAILPPIACTGSNEVAFVRSTSEFFGLKILVPTGGEGDFTLNGSAVNVGAGSFSDVPGTAGEWKYANITATGFVPTGSASRLENSSAKFHLGIINGGAATGTRYGYFSAFTTFEHETFVTDDNLCEGEMAELFCSPILNATYDWTGPNGFTDSGDAIEFGPITMADTGLYIVSGTVNGCEILPDTLELLINEQPEAPIVMAIPDVCEGDSWDWTSLTNADEYNWMNEAGEIIAMDSTVSWTNAGLDDAGSYELVVVSNACASAATAFEVVVNETITIAFNSPVVSYCSGTEWTLSPDQVLADTEWNWTLPDGSENNSETLAFTPIELTDSGTYSLGGMNAGCPMISGFIEVIVAEPEVLVLSVPEFICSSDEPIEITVNDSYQGSWASTNCPDCLSGDGDFDASGVEAGNIDITYTSDSPCATDAMAEIEVILTPNSDFEDFTACEGQGEVQMASEESGGIWTTSCGTCSNESGLFNTEIAGVGTWQVTHSIDGLCPVFSTGLFNVTDNLNSGFSVPSSLCANSPLVEFTAELAGGSWSASCGNCLESNGMFDASDASVGETSISYSLPGACGSNSVESVLIVPLPDAQFEFSSEGNCAPAVVSCVAASNPNAIDCQWSVYGNGATTVYDCNQSSFEITDSGCFELSHTVTDNSGCSNTIQASELLCLNTSPLSSFEINPSTPSLFDEFIAITANDITAGNTYNWNIGNTMQLAGGEIEFSLNSIGLESFEVCLGVTDPLNCTSVSCQTVALDEGMTAFAPTAFTPDQDGHNEAWKIVCNDAVKNFELKIFDRWGNIVFETKDKQEFWFGNSRGGTHFAPDGIYFYRAVIRNVNYEVRTLEGSVVLIR